VASGNMDTFYSFKRQKEVLHFNKKRPLKITMKKMAQGLQWSHHIISQRIFDRNKKNHESLTMAAPIQANNPQ